MEDQEGGLAAPEEERPPVKKKPDRKSHLTVLIMGSVGKVRSFQISSGMVLWGGIFLVGYIIFSLFTINSYVQLRRANKSQAETIGQMETDNSGNKRTLLRSKQHIALLEDYIRNLEGREPGMAPGKGLMSQEGEARPASEIGGKDKTSGEKSSPAPAKVDIADMVIQREGSRLLVSFKLVNANPEEAPVGGYIHILAMNKPSDPPKEWTHPQVKIENGKPVNHRQGQIFLIHRFKQLQGKINLGSTSESPSTIRVLVYDQTGLLMLEKEFEVRHAAS